MNKNLSLICNLKNSTLNGEEQVEWGDAGNSLTWAHQQSNSEKCQVIMMQISQIQHDFSDPPVLLFFLLEAHYVQMGQL